jgi:DNA-binding MarR family transcriptional regulator
MPPVNTVSSAAISPEAQDATQLGLLMRDIRVRLINQICACLASRGHDLNGAQFIVLKSLRMYGPIGPSQLAKHMGYDPGAMTRLIDKLERAALVQRRPDETDRRATLVSLTAQGEELAIATSECSEIAVGAALGPLDAAERTQLFALLTRVRDALEVEE